MKLISNNNLLLSKSFLLQNQIKILFVRIEFFFSTKTKRSNIFIVTEASTRAEASNGVVFVVTAISKDEQSAPFPLF